MIQITSRIERSSDRGVAVRVTTSRTFYVVAISSDEITLIGPGVEENYTIGEQIPNNLSFEGMACIAVLLFEERE